MKNPSDTPPNQRRNRLLSRLLSLSGPQPRLKPQPPASPSQHRANYGVQFIGDERQAALNGTVQGLRGWHVDLDKRSPLYGSLRGLMFRQPWTQGENEARCLQARRIGTATVVNAQGYLFDAEGQPVLQRGVYEAQGCAGVARHFHGCGFYAFIHSPLALPSGDVWGVVSMYGDIEVGKQGCRSSRAMILALWVNGHPRADHIASCLELRYPDVPIYDSRAAMVRDWPLTRYEDLP